MKRESIKDRLVFLIVIVALISFFVAFYPFLFKLMESKTVQTTLEFKPPENATHYSAKKYAGNMDFKQSYELSRIDETPIKILVTGTGTGFSKYWSFTIIVTYYAEVENGLLVEIGQDSQSRRFVLFEQEES